MSSSFLLERHLLLEEDDDMPATDPEEETINRLAMQESEWCDAGCHWADAADMNYYEWTDGDVTCCESCRLRAAERLAERGN